MAINFTPASLGNSVEKKIYDHIKILSPSPNGNYSAYWTNFDAAKISNGMDEITCMSYELRRSINVSCIFNPRPVNGIRPDGATILDAWNLGSKKVLEVRYGDIDKDGDIDIAVKLTDGAIYVFHNLSK